MSSYWNMPNQQAIVLINLKPDIEEGIGESLSNIDEITEVHGLYGIYDIIVFVEAASMSKLKDIINTKIRRLEGINSTLTMIVG
jgi:DNA-binding Lrp family transcriptional regulator